MAKEEQVSHGELVERIANAYERLDGEEMANLWNELFPETPVKYLGDSMYVWQKEKKPIPKCPNCNGEVEEKEDIDCYFCGYSGQPAYHDTWSIPICEYCDQHKQVAARYMIYESPPKKAWIAGEGRYGAIKQRKIGHEPSRRIWRAACIQHAFEKKTQACVDIRVHPLAADFTTIEDLDRYLDGSGHS